LGKLYRNIGELDEAREYFESVLEKNSERYETKLQLIRIYKSKEMISKEDVLKEYTNLIDEYINGKDISMSVVLAAYMEIYSYDKAGTIKKKYFLEYFEYFFKAVTSVAVETFDLPYNTLALQYLNEVKLKLMKPEQGKNKDNKNNNDETSPCCGEPFEDFTFYPNIYWKISKEFRK